LLKQTMMHKKNLKVLSLGELLDTKFPEREDLITPWMKQGESALIYAAPGVGKSMFVTTLALAVAGGGKLNDWTFPKPRKVLFWDGEMFVDELQDRARVLMPTIAGLDYEAVRKNFRLAARQHQEPDISFPDIAKEEGRKDILEMSKGCDLVVLDNLSTLATVEDENSAAAFNDVVLMLSKLKQYPTACILVHHSNKANTDARGSSKVTATFEVKMKLDRWDDPKNRGNTAFKLEWEKYRRQKTTDIKNSCMWLEGDDGGDLMWQTKGDPDSEIDKLIRLARSGEYCTQGELAKALGFSTGKLSDLINKAFLDPSRKFSKKEWDRCKNAATETRAESRTPRVASGGSGDDSREPADF
jgi:KaiC/GvpD/RAD55 family RecA-like ATPase